ncbi:hypothetical protein ElyMa_005724100 [Elysia marginata]|uniref:Uncharacterized protein n=1 Tax=Elysia marginata TaxID=1093978 RepID=A0AAV4FIS8_9GAST|nr:hypothetical protein ElyMa_005724100 [Elysia marginata]
MWSSPSDQYVDPSASITTWKKLTPLQTYLFSAECQVPRVYLPIEPLDSLTPLLHAHPPTFPSLQTSFCYDNNLPVVVGFRFQNEASGLSWTSLARLSTFRSEIKPDRVSYQDYTTADPMLAASDYRYISPRERYSADEVLRALSESRTDINPYGKVPPIDGGRGRGYRDDDHPSSAPIIDQGGSYMDVYMRQRDKEVEKPWYKVYGLKDYRKMVKEVRLGTLGPDLDSDATRERVSVCSVSFHGCRFLTG